MNLDLWKELNFHTSVMSVPGGFIYKYDDHDKRMAIVFVPEQKVCIKHDIYRHLVCGSCLEELQANNG